MSRVGFAQGETDSPTEQGSAMWDLILGPRDHDQSRRQTLNKLSHPGVPQCPHLEDEGSTM